jgi:serine/threonine-protein kinase
MDFVDGLDAARVLADRYPAGMPVEEVARIVTEVAGALDYAHKQGLLHRDVKPANVMVSHLDDEGEQRILLTDFGIARNVDEISGITKTNMTVGTVAYCAPEQLLGEDIDGRADQYSLAATAFHLLTGSQLFPHSNPLVVSNRHLNVPPPALADRRPELAKLDPILAIGLAKRPEHRFNRCSDFARALSEQINPTGAPTQADPTKPAPTSCDVPPVAKAPPQVHPSNDKAGKIRLVAATAAVAVILTAALIVIWRPWERQTIRSSQESAGPSTSMFHSPPPATATTAVQAPPPPTLFSPKAIDQVLLTAEQLSKLLGTDVTSDPRAGGGGAAVLAMDSSSYGTLDHSGQVTPRSCVGVVFTGEHDVYAASQPTEIKTQTFGTLYQSSNKGPHLLEQTAAVYPSAEQAQDFLTSSQAQWSTCAKGDVDATFGFENGAGYALGKVQRQGDLITVSMATNGGLNGPDACQQTLGAHENVIVETRTCQVPNVVTNFDPVKGWPRDPGWAVPEAERVATSMLQNVTP